MLVPQESARCDDRMVGAEDKEYDELVGYVYAVGERPLCCWDYDHAGRTLEFLDGLDTGYFGAVAALYVEQLESDGRLPASVALRVSYHQGLETLFSLLAATTQAPAAVPAWIASCKTDELTDVVRRLRDGRRLLTQAGRARVSLLELSEYVHRFAWPDESGEESTAAAFGRLWERLSREFLDDTARVEYNALKHGNRVLPGGFTLAIGTEETPGVLAPPGAMRSLGGSRFGSTFFAVERVGASRHHIRTRRTSVNWTPLSLAQRLMLISMSIDNIVGALRCGLGADPGSVKFVRPDPLSAFEDAWAREPGVRTTNMDHVIQVDPSDELSKERLLEILEHRADASGTDRDGHAV